VLVIPELTSTEVLQYRTPAAWSEVRQTDLLIRAKDESADLLSAGWLIPEKSAEFSESIC
jgi:hypothetical protein